MNEYATSYYNELYHYGVKGMKWGIRKAVKKSNRNESLAKKAIKLDKAAAKLYRRAEQVHALRDMGGFNRYSRRSGIQAQRSAANRLKALKTDSSMKKAIYEKRAAKLDYKSGVNKRRSDMISKQAGWGIMASKISLNSSILAKKADRARFKIAKNNLYIERLKDRVASIPDAEIQLGADYINRLRGL